MSLERLLLPIYLPRWMHRAVLGLKRAFIPPARINEGGRVTQAFTEQFSQFKEQSRLDGRFEPEQTDWFPFLNDDTPETGFDPHYVLHTSWAARALAKTKPKVHVSFGDSLYFVGIASAFTSVTFCDIRKSGLPFRDIEEDRADLTSLPPSWTGTLQSISCMHVLEHIGLGRYGDALDASGDRRAAAELARVLAPGGQLLLVVPMEDPPRVCFNAHRLYSYSQVMDLFPDLSLLEFTLITNEGQFFENADPCLLEGRKYSCGCFRYTK
jgi:SAM-dependent methyltransferase